MAVVAALPCWTRLCRASACTPAARQYAPILITVVPTIAMANNSPMVTQQVLTIILLNLATVIQVMDREIISIHMTADNPSRDLVMRTLDTSNCSIKSLGFRMIQDMRAGGTDRPTLDTIINQTPSGTRDRMSTTTDKPHKILDDNPR